MQESLLNLTLSPLITGILAFLTGIVVSYYAIPVVVKIAKTKGLVDKPNHRTSHEGAVPSLGGVAIFAGLILGSSLFIPVGELRAFRFVLASIIILFFIGQKDDILGLSPLKKFLAELMAASILIFLADIRIQSFHGFIGIHDIPDWASIITSYLLYLGIINAFNLIDGIDGLASGTGIMVSFLLGGWLMGIGEHGMGLVAWSLTGALIPFFFFNVFGQKNKLFMGDTGSLLLGLLTAIFVISICQYELPKDHFLYMKATPSVVIAVIIYPLFDMLRVFTLRLTAGRSPFSADRNHIHHLYIDAGFSHRRSSFYILTLNLMAIGFAWFMRNQSILLLGVCLLCGAVTAVVIVKAVGRHRAKL